MFPVILINSEARVHHWQILWQSQKSSINKYHEDETVRMRKSGLDFYVYLRTLECSKDNVDISQPATAIATIDIKDSNCNTSLK